MTKTRVSKNFTEEDEVSKITLNIALSVPSNYAWNRLDDRLLLIENIIPSLVTVCRLGFAKFRENLMKTCFGFHFSRNFQTIVCNLNQVLPYTIYKIYRGAFSQHYTRAGRYLIKMSLSI